MAPTTKSTKKKTPANKSTKEKDKVVAYEVVVEGQYYSQVGSTKELKIYEDVKIFLPEVVKYPLGRKEKIITTEIQNDIGDVVEKKVKSSEPRIVECHVEKCVKYVVKNFYIDEILKKQFQDFRGVRTIEITSMRRVKVESKYVTNFSNGEIDLMNSIQLSQFSVAHDLRVQLQMYKDLGAKRKVVKKAYEKKKAAEAEMSKKIAQVDRDNDISRPVDSNVEEVEIDVDDDGNEMDTSFLDK